MNRSAASLPPEKTKSSGKRFWHCEELDRYLARCWDSCVASESRLPVEAKMCTLYHGTGARVHNPGWQRNAVPLVLPRVGDAAVACTHADRTADSSHARESAHSRQPMDATVRSPGVASWWCRPAIGTAHAVHRDDNCECWQHTPAASFHQPLQEYL